MPRPIERPSAWTPETLPSDARKARRFPSVPFLGMDTLWLQVTGTLCNLRCTHCFISCAPDNHSHEMMTLEQVEEVLEEAVGLGVRDYYLTGGEPFLHVELFEMLRATLRVGPATVLTNGLLLDQARVARLRELSDHASYSLDLRVSLDGFEASTHDPIRGPGTFQRALDGAVRAAGVGINPVLTVTDIEGVAGSASHRAGFLQRMREIGLTRPRLKILPVFRIGREVDRGRAYGQSETLEGMEPCAEDLEALQCSSSRMVTSRGVYVCPILIERPEANMGQRLADSLRSYPLRSAACHTCHVDGATCRT